MYDLVVRNGRVVDGSGGAPVWADVGVLDGRIAKVGRIRESATRVIDAEGHVVTPGFIDGHTHLDAQVMWDELGSSSCYHGVTTVVMGNCGFSLAPCRPGEQELVVRNVERAEDMSAEVLAAGVDWSWESFGEYLDAVERRPKAINHAAYLGHSALRTWVMGERAFTDVATEDDQRLMEHVLAEALTAGAIGFTTSRQDSHATPAGDPVASRLASWEEVVRLVGVLGELEAGVFEVALERPALDEDLEGRRRIFERYADLSVATGVPVTFGVTRRPMLEGIDIIAARGGRTFAQTHSRGVESVMSFRTSMPFDGLATWSDVRSRALEEQRALLRDPDVRAKLVHEAHHGSYGHAIGAEARRPDFDAMQLYSQPLPPHTSVAEEAARRNVDPVELVVERALETDFDQLFVQAFRPSTTEDLRALLTHPRTVMTFSDTGAHVSQIADSSIHTHLLGYWVRELQALTLEAATRLVTLNAATAWGFADRGLVREGFVADLNVLDPDTVAPELPVVRADLPASGQRLVQKATGFLATVVGGEVVLEHGEQTGARPGRVLRGPLAG